MTKEHRLIVGIDDVRAIVLECKKCGSRLSLPPRAVKAEAFFGCGACGAVWVTQSITSGGRHFVAPAIRFASELDEVFKTLPDDSVGVRVLLEFDLPTP